MSEKRAENQTSDDWIGNPNIEIERQHHHHNLPQLKLEAFDGDFAKWPDFASGFKALVHDVVHTDYQRMAFLRMYLTPGVRSSISCQLSDPSVLGGAAFATRDVCHTLYGHPMLVVKASYQALVNLPIVKTNDLESLERFTGKLNDAIAGLKKTGRENEVYSIMTMESTLSKLPSNIRDEWGDQIMSMDREPNLFDLKNWLHRKIMGRRMTNASKLSTDFRPERQYPVNQKFNRRTVNTVQKTTETSSCPFCDQSHSLEACENFRAIESVDEGLHIVRNKSLCFRCFNRGHMGNECAKPKTQCGESGCKGYHHKLIHGACRTPPTNGNKIIRALRRVSDQPVEDNTITLITIVPVVIKDGSKSVETYAMIDPGSEVTLIHRDIAEKVDLDSRPSPWAIESWSGNGSNHQALSVDLSISNISNDFHLNIENAHVVPNLNISGRLVDWSLLRRDWPHLKGLEMPIVRPEEVGMLISQDVDEAMEIIMTRRSEKPLAPVAKLTKFGWTVVGKISNRYHLHDSTRKHHVCAIRKRPNNQDLKEAIERFWNIESFGVKPTAKLLTDEDQRAMQIIQSSIRKTVDRFEVGLPWKHEHPILPNNRETAMKRFYGLEKRFEKKPEYASRYENAVDQPWSTINLGHARRLKSEELLVPVGRTWYLPYHGVEQGGKLWVVFDASSRHLGQSLNDHLLQGPDLMTALFGVLVRFRENKHTVSADIEKMFNQVLVKENDRDALRFL